MKAAEIHFIQELILGDYEQSIGMQPPWDWVGPLETKKTFLFDIVANKRNGIDCDRMDYFVRDTHQLNVAKSFDALRLMKFARVYPVQRDDTGTFTEICFHKKECWNITELFFTRATACTEGLPTQSEQRSGYDDWGSACAGQ